MGFANQELKLLLNISKVLEELQKTGDNTNGSVNGIENEQSLSHSDFKKSLELINETNKNILRDLNSTASNTDNILNTNNKKLDELIKSNNNINNNLENLASILNQTNELLSDIKTNVGTIKYTKIN